MARVIINSVDSFGEKTTEKIIAKKTFDNEAVVYSYSNKTGQGEIRISPYSAKILRKGEIESQLIVIPNEKTDFIYHTPYFKGNFQVYCKNYLYAENKLTITYSIYDNGSEINQLQIEIIEIQ